MKVSTELKAGSLLQDVTNQAGAMVGQVSNFVTTANQQAQGLTTSLVDRVTGLWNCLTGK
jgi:hypothetical protein